MLHFLNLQFQIPHPTQAKVKIILNSSGMSNGQVPVVFSGGCWCVLNWLAHYRGQQKINPSDLMFRSGRESAGYKFNIPTCADIRLIQTPHYYRQFALSLWKESPYIFYKFSVSVLTGLNCTTWTCIQSLHDIQVLLHRTRKNYTCHVHGYIWIDLMLSLNTK